MVEKVSLAEDFIDIFYAPSAVYARRANSGVGVPLLVITLAAAAFAFASRNLMTAALEAEWPRMMAQMMAKSPEMTEDVANRARGFVQVGPKILSYIEAPVAILVVAALTWLAAKVVKAQITFQQAMVVSTFAWVPRLVRGVANTLQSLFMDPLSITGIFSITYSPARFLDPDSSPKLLGILSRFDVFILWSTVLLAIGIAVVGRVPRSKGALAAALIFVVASLPVLIR